MNELMYDFDSTTIVAVLFAVLMVVTEGGFRSGRRYQKITGDSTKSQINTVQASLLGVLALLIGFTFSLSLQRYEARSSAVISEANAIGTAALRTGLLHPEFRQETKALLREYVDVRIQEGSISLDRSEERSINLRATEKILQALWARAEAAAVHDANPVKTGLFIQALNELIDAYGIRVAALDRHVPEVVLLLLFATFTLTVMLVGFASGIAGQRAAFPTYIMVLLIALLVFIIIDLDRPRRGLIEVSQQSLVELRSMPQIQGVSDTAEPRS